MLIDGLLPISRKRHWHSSLTASKYVPRDLAGRRSLSARREYLRVKRRDLILDICAAPFGTGFLVSWWLGPKPGILGFFYAIPVVGVIFGYLTQPFTYHRIDTALMFQEAVNDSVQEVIEALTKAQGLRSLSENERKAILRDFFQS